MDETHGRVSAPDFRGRAASQAHICTEVAGLSPEEAGDIQDAAAPTGRVARQEPASDTIPAGGTVKVRLSTGRP
ncbi:PASTA domain-containing protein [Kitasatospora sp. NPDC088346]|uniref:PASTA domain-containing protein n=1 Tax=Kitasatospora sp. NPDC088346 TaxID=3364073 RepID=UPI00381B6D7A